MLGGRSTDDASLIITYKLSHVIQGEPLQGTREVDRGKGSASLASQLEHSLKV